jgi:hypothetical protein
MRPEQVSPQVRVADPPAETTVRLEIRSVPDGVTVEIDGKPLGKTPIAWTAKNPAPNESHQFRFMAEGYQEYTVDRTLSDEAVQVLDARLEPIQASAPVDEKKDDTRSSKGKETKKSSNTSKTSNPNGQGTTTTPEGYKKSPYD